MLIHFTQSQKGQMFILTLLDMLRCLLIAHLMSSSVTMKALHSGCAVFSQTPGFFSTAADSWPVMGAALVWMALAIADRRVLSVQPGPTPEVPAVTF